MPHLGDTYRSAVRLESDELALARIALDATHECMLVHTIDGVIVLFNDAMAASIGLTVEEFASLPPWGWSAQPPEARVRLLDQIRSHPGGYIFRSKVPREDGQEQWTEIRATFVGAESGGLIVAVSHDVTDQVRAERILTQMAFEDPLTGVGNRAAFDEGLSKGMETAKRHGDLLGVVFADIDGFKSVNDEFGHEVGDRVLSIIGSRLKHVVRTEDTIARFGGDEFVMVAPRLESAEDLVSIADKFAAAIAKPIRVGDHEFTLHAATGHAVYDPESDDARSLVMRADLAMYESKRAHRV